MARLGDTTNFTRIRGHRGHGRPKSGDGTEHDDAQAGESAKRNHGRLVVPAGSKMTGNKRHPLTTYTAQGVAVVYKKQKVDNRRHNTTEEDFVRDDEEGDEDLDGHEFPEEPQDYSRHEEDTMDDEYDQDGIKDENHYGNNEKGEELDPKNADGFEDDKNQDRVVHAEKWSKFCRLAESKENADPVPNLQVYLAAKKKRTDAIRKLETIFENSMGEMKAVAASILNETLVKVHGKEQDEVESIERDVTTFFQSNDGRRKGLLKTMEFANKKWDKQYTAITDRILNVNFEADDDKLQAKPAAVIDETDDVSAESMTRTTEPDWHALAEYEPSRENVETFVGLLDKRQGATTELEDMLNDVRSQFEMVAGETFQAAKESHHVTQAGCDDYERELELYMMANHKGRRNMRQLLIESEQRAQERFLKLRSRLAV